MNEYVLVVYSNPAPGREAEYNDWYNNQHLRDVLQQPGYVSARRFKLTDFKLDDAMPNPAHRYVAFYNMVTDDPEQALNDMKERVNQGIIGLTDAMAPDFLAFCYAAACPQLDESQVK
ncbi:MAG: DUF4286 family protein [Pseudomonadota bacterium]|nr:DUF4286 family protein [Pseudomonadota bacterium]